MRRRAGWHTAGVGLVLVLEKSLHDRSLGSSAVPADRSKVWATATMVADASAVGPPWTTGDRLGVGVGGRPAEAERVAGGIRVDLEDLGRLRVVGRLQEPRAQ